MQQPQKAQQISTEVCMPITVNVVNGHPSSQLTANAHFVWVNPTLNQVTITDCIGFCTQASYTIPARTATGQEKLRPRSTLRRTAGNSWRTRPAHGAGRFGDATYSEPNLPGSRSGVDANGAVER